MKRGDFMDYNEFVKLKSDKNNIFPKGTEPQEAIDILADLVCKLNNCSYIANYPANNKQINTEVVCEILYRLRKRTFWNKIKDILGL